MPVNAWIVIAAAGLGSYLFRLSMIMLTGRITTPASLERAAAFVAPAAFAALAAAGIATACMHLGAAQAAAPLAAVAVAIFAALRTGSSYAAIVAGMPTLWITAALLPS
jgi:branched-subunit amino acid transport protein